jgi:alpha-tubulin suppressor-like RCC1 family protein
MYCLTAKKAQDFFNRTCQKKLFICLLVIAQEFLFPPGLAQVAFGEFYVLLLDSAGKIYSLGTHHFGVLGLGDVADEIHVPTPIDAIETPAVEIECGMVASYAITTQGEAFSWGAGDSCQVILNCFWFHSEISYLAPLFTNTIYP